MRRPFLAAIVVAVLLIALLVVPAVGAPRPSTSLDPRADAAATAVASTFHSKFTVFSSATGGGCTPSRPNLPRGVPVRLESILVSLFGTRPSDAPRLAVNFEKKLSNTADLDFELGIPLTTKNGYGYATGLVRPGPLVVKVNEMDDAAIGDIFDVAVCANRGMGGTGTQARAIFVGVVNPT